MIAIVRAISSTFFGTVEESDTLFPVLMFTIAGLLLVDGLLAGGMPPATDFVTF